MFLIKRFYHYIGLCPYCHSKHTGRIIYGYDINPTKSFYIMLCLAKRKGEYIHYRHGNYNSNKTAFCDDCGGEWREEAKLLFLTQEEWEQKMDTKAIKMPGYHKAKKIGKKNKRKNKRRNKK